MALTEAEIDAALRNSIARKQVVSGSRSITYPDPDKIAKLLDVAIVPDGVVNNNRGLYITQLLSPGCG